ncbi:DUF4333 domain-containing protein [Terracoccus sp. 273MFTsu3.1]|uniref:DUF4333 domain-containing protein n=1 Tax=Terracoccus sp. 273MFTsu3.1 TaxID=1172188 RepID=UPI0003797ACF|nr:DUF4333 domain-containing protein [Terracoccus sp. 273MFTsu3.1]
MSDPNPSPNPAPYAYYGQQPATGPVAAPGPMLVGPTSNAYRGLTIAAFVMSALALLGVVAIAGLGLLASLGPGDGTGGMVPLTGTLPSTTTLAPLSGADLERAVSTRITQDGAGAVDMTCPETRQVTQNVTTVCHGTIDGDEWAVVVFFEDDNGTFTLLPA